MGKKVHEYAKRYRLDTQAGIRLAEVRPPLKAEKNSEGLGTAARPGWRPSEDRETLRAVEQALVLGDAHARDREISLEARLKSKGRLRLRDLRDGKPVKDFF